MTSKLKKSEGVAVEKDDFDEAKSSYNYLSEFFTLEKASRGESGVLTLTFKCKNYLKSCNSSSKAPTSNLGSHISHCHQGKSQEIYVFCLIGL